MADNNNYNEIRLFLELYHNNSNQFCQPGQCTFVFRGKYLTEFKHVWSSIEIVL